MKKLFPILCLILSLSLSACSSKNVSSTTNVNDSQTGASQSTTYNTNISTSTNTDSKTSGNSSSPSSNSSTIKNDTPENTINTMIKALIDGNEQTIKALNKTSNSTNEFLAEACPIYAGKNINKLKIQRLAAMKSEETSTKLYFEVLDENGKKIGEVPFRNWIVGKVGSVYYIVDCY